jgi:hypothetical protein
MEDGHQFLHQEDTIIEGVIIELFKEALGLCRMDIPGPTTSVGTRTDYSVGPWDYPAWAAQHLLAWSTRISVEKYSDRKLCMSCTM